MMPLTRQLRHRRAFTTVEILATLTVGLILSVVAMAGFQLYERESPVRYTAKSLTQALATARTYAISGNAVYTVQIDRQHGNYWIDETNDVGTVVVPKVVPPQPFNEKVSVESIRFAVGDPVSQQVVPIRFFADGSSDDVRINLVQGGGGQTARCQVRLYGPTGQSALKEM